MTYSYSSKKFGMGQQQVEDLMKPLGLSILEGKIPSHPFAHPDDTVINKEGKPRHMGDGYAAAKYLAGHIYNAIEEIVTKPAEAMAFLQKIARALAHEGKPLSWTTPTGLPWINRYHEHHVKHVELWMQDKRMHVTVADGYENEINKDRAANGVAPNLVHACDAAHLLLTVRACKREGIDNVATVHDSFGCLAPQAARFNQIIR